LFFAFYGGAEPLRTQDPSKIIRTVIIFVVVLQWNSQAPDHLGDDKLHE
jgi:hypothetical protein